MTSSDNCKMNEVFERFLQQEKSLEPNAFAGTRILQYIESEFEPGKSRRFHNYTGIFQPLLLSTALIFAVLLGYFFGKQEAKNNFTESSASNSLEVIKSELFIHDFIDDDKTLVLKNK
jgi:hypothetical protein